MALSRIGAFDRVTAYIAHWPKTYETISMIDPDLVYTFGPETRLTANIVYREVLPHGHHDQLQDSRTVQNDATQGSHDYVVLRVVPERKLHITRNTPRDASHCDNKEDSDPGGLLSKYYKCITFLDIHFEGK